MIPVAKIFNETKINEDYQQGKPGKNIPQPSE
jgi:hypothetical protein